MPWVQCLQCQRWFVGHHSATLCSDECRHQRYLAKIKESNAKKYKPLVPLTCIECGLTFTPRNEKGRRKRYCSALCAKRATKRTERQRVRVNRRGVKHFTLLEVAVRDGWRCHICRRKVRQKDATMDHLVPKSKGGEHTMQNVRLAHRLCNSRRGVDRIPAQLLLLG